MRLQLASLASGTRLPVALGILAAIVLLLLLPPAFLSAGLISRQSELAITGPARASLTDGVDEARGRFSDRIARMRPSREELASVRDADTARSAFTNTVASLVEALETAGIRVTHAGPEEEDQLSDVWVETRFLLRLEGQTDDILMVLTGSDFAALDVIRFDLRSQPEPGVAQLDIEFRLVREGALDVENP